MAMTDMDFMEIAKIFAQKSHCVSHKVGCIAVKDGRIIATGYNGTLPGQKNCDEIFNEEKFSRKEHHIFSDNCEIHAEQNLIAFAAKHGLELNNCTIYTTLFPCVHCMKLLCACGIDKIIYCNEYDFSSNAKDGMLERAKNMNIQILKIGE